MRQDPKKGNSITVCMFGFMGKNVGLTMNSRTPTYNRRIHWSNLRENIYILRGLYSESDNEVWGNSGGILRSSPSIKYWEKEKTSNGMSRWFCNESNKQGTIIMIGLTLFEVNKMVVFLQFVFPFKRCQLHSRHHHEACSSYGTHIGSQLR